MTKKLHHLELPDSGVVVTYVGVSRISTMLRLKKKFPKPKAPMVKVEIAGVERWERNEADPDYAVAVANWDSLLGIETMDAMLNRIAAVQTLDDDARRDVEALRAQMNGELDDLSDGYIWLTEIAISSDNDLNALLETVAGKADPSQEGINQAADSFRREV